VESEILGGPLSRGDLGMLCEAIGGAWSSHALDLACELHIGWKVVRGLERRPKKAMEGAWLEVAVGGQHIWLPKQRKKERS
jgi:hypothetical protein